MKSTPRSVLQALVALGFGYVVVRMFSGDAGAGRTLLDYLAIGTAQGAIYADDLRRIADTCVATASDLARIDALVDYLVALHVPLSPPDTRYRRAIRDLVGSGEGIFGIIDGYPASVPGATALRRFLGTPEAMRLLRAPGDGVPPSRFKPPVYVTIWS